VKKQRDKVALEILEVERKIRNTVESHETEAILQDLRERKRHLQTLFHDLTERLGSYTGTTRASSFLANILNRKPRTSRRRSLAEATGANNTNNETDIEEVDETTGEDGLESNNELTEALEGATAALTNTETADKVIEVLTTSNHPFHGFESISLRNFLPHTRAFNSFRLSSESDVEESEYFDDRLLDLVDPDIYNASTVEESDNDYPFTSERDSDEETEEVNHTNEEPADNESVHSNNNTNAGDSDTEEVVNNNNRMVTIDDWRNFARTQTTALTTGFKNMNALQLKREIPEFSGDMDESLPIDEWFKIADKVAATGDWTDNQKLKYYKDRLTKSATNFSEALDPAIAADYEQWRTAMLEGFQDVTLRNLRKGQLKHLKQKQKERVRDFKKRIDETYRNAYGIAVDDSQNDEVMNLKDEIKKETFFNGLRSEIAVLMWGRLPNDSDYDQATTTAMECESLLELKRATEFRTLGQTIDEEKKVPKIDVNDLKSVVQEIVNQQLSTVTPIGSTKTIAYIEEEDNGRRVRERVRFADQQRNRHYSPNPQRFSRPTFRQPYRQRTASPRPASPGWRSTEREESQERETRTCYFCKHRGHIKRECRKYKYFMESRRNGNQQNNRGRSTTPNYRRN
jgi:hypothetical protein